MLELVDVDVVKEGAILCNFSEGFHRGIVTDSVFYPCFNSFLSSSSPPIRQRNDTFSELIGRNDALWVHHCNSW